MKTGVLAFGLLLLSAALVGTVWVAGSGSAVAPSAEETPKDLGIPGPPVSPTAPWPSVSLVEKEFKFGQMGVGESLSHTFVVKNVGEAPLTLKQGRTSCTCTMSELKDDKVAVGGEAKVTLTWEPRKVDPMFRQTATILTDDPQNKQFEFVVQGEVVDVVTITPAGEWSLGEISDEKTAGVTGRIFSRLLESFKIVSLESSNPSVKVEYEPISEEELKDRSLKSGYDVKVSVLPGLPVGPVLADLKVTAEQPSRKEGEKPETKEYVIHVRGTRTGPLQLLQGPGTVWHPEVMAIEMGNFPAAEGKKARLLVFVTGMGDKPFEITKVDTDTPFLKVDLVRDTKFESKSKQRYDLYFEVPPGSPIVSKIRKESARVTLETNHPDAPQLKFRIEMVTE